MKEKFTWARGDIWRGLMLLACLAADQLTKWQARAYFSLPDGEPDYFKIVRVAGEWLQLRLVYNSGAAFGLKPQNYIPLLSPTVFFVLFSTVAISALLLYYRKLGEGEAWPKAGVALILSGAFGNLIDRLRFARVTDFIDAGIPGVDPRWPTFNVADSCVCVGVALILLAPALSRKPVGSEPSRPAPEPAIPD